VWHLEEEISFLLQATLSAIQGEQWNFSYNSCKISQESTNFEQEGNGIPFSSLSWQEWVESLYQSPVYELVPQYYSSASPTTAKQEIISGQPIYNVPSISTIQSKSINPPSLHIIEYWHSYSPNVF
jgi:hypothetical protein